MPFSPSPSLPLDSPLPLQTGPAIPHASVARPIRPRPALWTVRTRVETDDEDLAVQCGISPVTAAILRLRGQRTVDAANRFLQPDFSLLRDPRELPDIEIATARLRRAIAEGEKLLVFGDYDVDGVTSTALLVRSLRALGANLEYRIPEREEGYGLSVAAVEEAAAAGVQLIMTADCGITANVPAQRARELGVDLIITDHHDVPEVLPDALAVVNPKREDSRYGFRELSGCGVAYKVVQALLLEHWPKHAGSFEEKFVDLVALAAVADCVSLTDENRYLTFEGLRRLKDTRKPGLRALMKLAELKVTGDSLQGHHVSFRLAPRLNAAGRLSSPRVALDLLLSKDDDECHALAQKLEELNRQRQAKTKWATDEAAALVDSEADLERDCLIVAAREGWHKGVVGLIASKLVEKYHRPAFAMNIHDGVAHGSGRSIDGFDLHDLVEATRQYLISGGGHAAACGLSLPEEKLPHFREAAQEFAGQRLQIDQLVPRVEADVEVNGHHVTPQLATDLQKLEPCGTGNMAATLMLRRAKLLEVRPIGQTGEHFKWRLLADGRTCEAVWWRSNERMAEFTGNQLVDLVFVPELNSYNGRTNVQLVIKDARAV